MPAYAIDKRMKSTVRDTRTCGFLLTNVSMNPFAGGFVWRQCSGTFSSSPYRRYSSQSTTPSSTTRSTRSWSAFTNSHSLKSLVMTNSRAFLQQRRPTETFTRFKTVSVPFRLRLARRHSRGASSSPQRAAQSQQQRLLRTLAGIHSGANVCYQLKSKVFFLKKQLHDCGNGKTRFMNLITTSALRKCLCGLMAMI